MRYSCKVTINRPRSQVVALFANPDNFIHWHIGLIRVEPVSGTPGETGAVSTLVYQRDYRESEIQQTVVAVDLPRELTVLYETRRLRNLHKNLFYEDGSKTLYVSELEFKFKPLMAVLSFFIRGAFKQQTLNEMQRFRAFVESVSPTDPSLMENQTD